jgi:hypothetical protein
MLGWSATFMVTSACAGPNYFTAFKTTSTLSTGRILQTWPKLPRVRTDSACYELCTTDFFHFVLFLQELQSTAAMKQRFSTDLFRSAIFHLPGPNMLYKNIYNMSTSVKITAKSFLWGFLWSDPVDLTNGLAPTLGHPGPLTSSSWRHSGDRARSCHQVCVTCDRRCRSTDRINWKSHWVPMISHLKPSVTLW